MILGKKSEVPYRGQMMPTQTESPWLALTKKHSRIKYN